MKSEETVSHTVFKIITKTISDLYQAQSQSTLLKQPGRTTNIQSTTRKIYRDTFFFLYPFICKLFVLFLFVTRADIPSSEMTTVWTRFLSLGRCMNSLLCCSVGKISPEIGMPLLDTCLFCIFFSSILRKKMGLEVKPRTRVPQLVNITNM